MGELDVLLSMIENPTRRRILESLVKSPQYPFQLSKELGISQQAVMKNLSILEKNGMVVSYQESSTMGPNRTVYEPNSEFTLYVDMRNGMFSVRMTKPDDKVVRKKVSMENISDIRYKIAKIDKRIDALDRERSALIRERGMLMADSLSRLNDSYCGYGHKSLMYEMLDNPSVSIEQLSSDLGARKDVVDAMVEDIEFALKQKEGDSNGQ